MFQRITEFIVFNKTFDGTVWAGSWGGGLWSKTPDDKIYTIKDNLVNPVVYSFLEDRAGQLWIGTNGGGY
jgi:ligand-binding sensor domain-containing protein